MSWPTRPLGELCNLEIGKTPSRANPDYWRDGTLPWLSIADMNQGRHLRVTKECVTDAGAKSARMKIVTPGTIVLSYKLSIGKVGFVRTPMFTNEAIAALANLDADVWPDYMYWALQHMDLLEGADRAAMGITLNKAKLEQLRVPLPPLPEQRRIAAILDKADALRAKRREAIAKLDQLLQSVFLDMFGDAVTNLKGWQIVEVGTLVIDGPQNGLYKPASDYGTGTPILRIDGFRAGDVIDRLPPTRLRLDQAEIAKYRLRPADLVINRVNSPEHLGKPALIGALSEDVVFESNMMRLSLDQDRVSPRYLLKCLLQKSVRDQISKRRKDAVNQSSINQTDVGTLTIPLPPIAMQKKFAAIVDAVSKQQVRIEAATHAVGSMLGSIQQAAFSGAF